MKNRGVKLRFISEITKDNLSYCKDLMGIGEVRHLDEVKGNFGIADGSLYHAGATANKSAPPSELIISTVKAIVDQQQYFFDMLWRKAIPAKQRIKEIEEHAKRQFIDTIQDSAEINDLVHKLVRSAKEEILMLFPTTNTFYRDENDGLMKSLKDIALRSGINIRILVHLDNLNTRESINRDYTDGERITVLMLQKSGLQPKVITMIIDNEYSLAIELEDDSALDSTDGIGFATYSNSDSTVATYLSIFETLWIQAELKN